MICHNSAHSGNLASGVDTGDSPGPAGVRSLDLPPRGTSAEVQLCE